MGGVASRIQCQVSRLCSWRDKFLNGVRGQASRSSFPQDKFLLGVLPFPPSLPHPAHTLPTLHLAPGEDGWGVPRSGAGGCFRGKPRDHRPRSLLPLRRVEGQASLVKDSDTFLCPLFPIRCGLPSYVAAASFLPGVFCLYPCFCLPHPLGSTWLTSRAHAKSPLWSKVRGVGLL